MRKVTQYALAGMALALCLAGCREAPDAVVPNVVVAPAASLPAEPSDEVWNQAPEYATALIPQDQVDPRQMERTTGELRIRASTDGVRVVFRLQWTDQTQDDLATSATFSDACAVQLPGEFQPTIPAPQMGESGHPVHITYWSAAWQAALEGQRDSLKDLYPNATVDHYPFEAPSLEPGSAEQEAMAVRYAPARALGNLMARPREKPVQDLIAEGPGTLTATASTASDGRGERSEDGWTVVITRQLPEGFDTAAPAQVAFAVWEGSHKEVGARKMRTGWITLTKLQKP